MRRTRRTANARRILEHYGIARNADPLCFGCEVPVDAWGDLDRAHLVDHAKDGLDGPQNLVMLCRACHLAMPSFGAGDGEAARQWVLHRPRYTRGSVQPAEFYRRRKIRTWTPRPAQPGPLRDAVGLAEIAERMGVRRQMVAVWRLRGVMPTPYRELAMGPVWDWASIEQWARETGRLQ